MTAPAGAKANVPPVALPLGFLLAGGIGLVTFGGAILFHAHTAVAAPQNPDTIAVVHFGVLTFLSTAVLGALHQFGPVVGQRRLRSVAAAWATLATMVTATWLLPVGFAHGPKSLVIAAALVGAVAVCLAAWNLSGPLSGRDGGVPVAGLRLSVAYLVGTVTFGVVYAFDRQSGWFVLLGHRVLAHAHLGLLGWLGLTYMAVAEKLWPMFLLAHRPRARSGAWAVALVATGTAILATGLLFAQSVVTGLGAAIVIGGVVAHLTSLAGAVKHRRRSLELLHAFLFASATFLVTAVVVGILAALAPVGTVVRGHLVSAEVASLIAWLGLAVIGHSHKIVPFISYARLRERGVQTHSSGRPLLFGDLFNARWAVVAFVLATAGFAAVVVGIIAGASPVVAAGGAAVAAAGAVATVNLAIGPRLAMRASAGQSETPLLETTT
ncbi:MAG: hypothetical protein U0U69_02715 [Acidimicrobiia bacterium]